MTTAAPWMAMLLLAVLWPSHTLSAFHGVPLDSRTQAILVGLALPLLGWLHPKALSSALVRAAIVALLIIKAGDSLLLTQQGLCAKFSTAAPYNTSVLTIPIDEPSGALRSWDVRAGWRAASPSCTAIVGRPYETTAAFPAWFTNITTFDKSAATAVTLDVSGYVRTGERGLFVLETADRPFMTALEPGTHAVAAHLMLSGDRWRFVPTFNGRDAFASTMMTVGEPRAIDRLAGVVAFLESALVVFILLAWAGALAMEYAGSPALLGWTVAATAVFVAVGLTGRFERLSVLLLAGAVAVPVASRHRNLRGAMMLVAVPWLALIAARSLPQVAHFTTYSNDDWLAYQVAGYRIYMNGFWLEAGSKSFDYQPLYRWISGALHLVFGDSSVGETLWDGVCLWLGGAVAFVLVDRVAGFKWALLAAAGALITFWTGTIWYFVGRGLSEVSAAGFGFVAALLLVRNDAGRVATAILAGLFAVLMFYTRLNHLLFGLFLIVLMARFRPRAALAYLATFAAGVALFATRTWWYTGVFSILHGTSLKNNDTGLRLTTIASADVWSRVWHSLLALVWMNEPPSPDPRAVLVVAGVLLSIGALLQLPKLSRLPLAIAFVTLGACVSSLLAHTHNYPGRMSIHLVPFAVAMTATAGARLFAR